MTSRKKLIHRLTCRFIFFNLLLPAFLFAETKTWTGYGGDDRWMNPLNWSGASVPLSTDDVLLDNGDLPVSYLVTLPDVAVILRTLLISPSPGRNIELQLPVSNKITEGFSVTGPGYGIELKAGAIFRNASGILSGESMHISDSIMIHDGGRYIHQTRASHANGILKFLSTAPGTEQGIFDFDVPRASYTLSISNRTYGSLELHSAALGSTVNYTCSGSNPLLIRGNLRIGPNVNMSMDLGGVNGNMQIEGDFIQEGGQMNLASGAGDNMVMRIRGDLYQASTANITETNNGHPIIELNGGRLQEIALAGRINNQVGFRLNNARGATLHLPLIIPWQLELSQGALYSSATAMIILDSGCTVSADSTRLTGSYVDGPMQKLGLNMEDHYLFPVGKDGNLRWLELKNASGNYTVEYFRRNPASLGVALGPGLDHISKLEYWTVIAEGSISNQAKIELSFASIQSGGITDPDYLNVARYQSSLWQDAGHSAITGNYIQGSVLSNSIDFSSQSYTLASKANLENPLPMTIINLDVKEISNKPVFRWSVDTEEVPDHFDLYEETGGIHEKIVELKAVKQQSKYSWTGTENISAGIHYYRVRMVDVHAIEFEGKIVSYEKRPGNPTISLISANNQPGAVHLRIQIPATDDWQYEILSVNGGSLEKGSLKLKKGNNFISVGAGLLSHFTYVFRATDSRGNNHSLLLIKS